MTELSFQVSFTERQYARSLYRRSNPNSLHVHCIGGPTQTHLSGFLLFLLQLFLCLVCTCGKQSLYLKSHIHNFVSVLILRGLDVCGLVPLGVLILVNLDVLGLLVDLLLGDLLLGDWFRFSARSS